MSVAEFALEQRLGRARPLGSKQVSPSRPTRALVFELAWAQNHDKPDLP